jgi:Rieske Fe-S protein
MSEHTQPTDQPTQPVAGTRLSRRHALTGVAGIGIGVPLLAACGGDESAVDPQAATTQTPATPEAPAAGETAEPAASFASTSDVPVGGGAVFLDEGLVVTQPSDGEFLGFSITCPHQGCPVDRVTEEGIVCPCHGSVFDLASGAPTAGPAQSPLGAVQLRIQGTDISRA